MTDQTLLTSRVRDAAIITLNRPEKHNAMDSATQERLLEVLEALVTDRDVRGIIITGEGESFSSGADLGVSRKGPTARDTLPRLRAFRRITELIERHPKPVIAAISGWCLTGGLELALACDLRVADATSRFGITSSRLGSVAGYGGTQRLSRLVGAAAAKEILFLAEHLDATDAYRLNLINRLVPAGRALEESLSMVDVLAQRGPLAVELAKQAVNVGLQMDLHSGLELELSLCARAADSEDRAEGVASFLEKRPARFKGY